MIKFIIIIFIFILSLSYLSCDDQATNYGFMQYSQDSDLIALVTCLSSLNHGYTFKVNEILFSSEELNQKRIVIFGNTGFHGNTKLKLTEGYQYVAAVRSNKKDSYEENDYLTIIEKKGTYYLFDDSCILRYDDGFLSGRFKPFGWHKDMNGEDVFIKYQEETMGYSELKRIILQKR